ncbi:hypothetical protein ACQ0QQ_02320 [Lysinibacillus sphaericus]
MINYPDPYFNEAFHHLFAPGPRASQIYDQKYYYQIAKMAALPLDPSSFIDGQYI